MILQDLGTLPLSVLGLLAMAEMLLTLTMTVRFYMLNLKPKLYVSTGIFFIFSAYLCLEISETAFLRAHPEHGAQLHPPLAHASFSIVVSSLLVIAAAGIAMHLYAIGGRRLTLSNNSVKEAMDELSDGICFSAEDGRPWLVNKAFNALSNHLFGTNVLNANLFMQQLQSREFTGKAEVILSSPLTLDTGEAGIWEIRQRHVNGIVETAAIDITAEHALRRELSERRKKLELLNVRLREYNENVETIARRKEQLETKTQVHNHLGRFLMELKLHLADPEMRADQSVLEAHWKETVSLLLSSSADPEETDATEELWRVAAATGVKLNLTGALPADKESRDVCLKGIFECIINTVKHAGGDTVDADCARDHGMFVLTIRNNGDGPSGQIRESGGLANLRQNVEQACGTMEIFTQPAFKIIITLPDKET